MGCQRCAGFHGQGPCPFAFARVPGPQFRFTVDYDPKKPLVDQVQEDTNAAIDDEQRFTALDIRGVRFFLSTKAAYVRPQSFLTLSAACLVERPDAERVAERNTWQPMDLCDITGIPGWTLQVRGGVAEVEAILKQFAEKGYKSEQKEARPDVTPFGFPAGLLDLEQPFVFGQQQQEAREESAPKRVRRGGAAADE
jgi:hypothetical protein